MSEQCIRQILVVLFLAMALVTAGFSAETVQPPATSTQESQAGIVATTIVTNEPDSEETRQRLEALLDRYPPQVGVVLKLDPSLLNSETYLASYPALAAFLKEHPEVAHNPAFFLQSVRGPGDHEPQTPAMRIWESTMEGVTIILVFLVVTSVLAWLVKTLIEQRRWSRLSRVQTEVHNKLLDRFAANEDLLRYIQTPVGRRFLESAPIPVEAGPRSVTQPIGRILWPLQAGVVLAAGGLGMLFVSGRVPADVAPALFAMGVLGLCIGVGFAVSGGIAFLLTRRLGLWPEAPLGEGEAAPANE